MSTRQESESPQRDSSILAAAILIPVLGTLVYFGFDAFPSDRSRLCIVITGLFLVGVVKNALDVRFIQRELDLANQQLVAIEAAPGVHMFLRACIPGVFRDHVASLFEIYRRDNLISQDNLVSLLQLKLQARIRLTQQLASVIVTLGLVGTVVGLVFAVQPMADAFKPGGDIKTSMAQTMDSMKTAFYTTLFGAVMGGVALRVLSSLVQSQSESLVGHIAELCEVHLIPAMRNAAKYREVVPLDEIPEDIDLRKYGLQPEKE